jgi:hypothetical protein
MMSEKEEFFYQTSIANALELSNRDCLKFLQGMLFFGGEHPATEGLRRLVMARAECDAQLELIAKDQMKFRELLAPEASR